ncbi:MAG: serine/threonine protein phosphatase, partial [Methanoregulaceae archaeon]|nr:serine/threonine protein phosphatase [Methanoregulaceae archaeon]
IIHSDLSEFNVMHDGSRSYIIDWPQWVGTDHPNARELLYRDISNITRYFSRRYGIKVTASWAYNEVIG